MGFERKGEDHRYNTREVQCLLCFPRGCFFLKKVSSREDCAEDCAIVEDG